RAAVLAPAARGRGGRRPDRDHRRRAGRRRRHPRGAADRRRDAGRPGLRPHRGGLRMTTPPPTALQPRKATAPLAGFWLQLATAGATLAAVVILLMVDKSGTSLEDVLSVGVQPAGVLLPIVGILLVTSEWSQRTALLTFTLVPARLPVLAAKV